MPITVTHNVNPIAQGRAAYAAGAGQYNQYLQSLDQRQQQLNQAQQGLQLEAERNEIARQEVVQRDRIQQREIAFQDVINQRGIREADQDRRERLENANRQLAFSEGQTNWRQHVGEINQNARLQFSENNQNARFTAGLANEQFLQQQKIAAAQQQQVLGAQIAAQQSRQQGLINAQLQQQRAVQSAQLQSQRSQLGIQEAYATAPIRAQQYQIANNLQLREQGYQYNPQQQAQYDQLQTNIQKIQGTNLSPAYKQALVAQMQQEQAMITPSEVPPSVKLRQAVEGQFMPGNGGYFQLDPATGQATFTESGLQQIQARGDLALQQKLAMAPYDTYGENLKAYNSGQDHLSRLMTSKEKWVVDRMQQYSEPDNGINYDLSFGASPPSQAQMRQYAEQEYAQLHPYSASQISSLQSAQPPQAPMGITEAQRVVARYGGQQGIAAAYADASRRNDVAAMREIHSALQVLGQSGM